MDDLSDPPRLDALIRWAARRFGFSPTPMIDARALAKAAFGLDEAALIIDGDRVMNADAVERFAEMTARREQEEPIAHIIGRREFWSLDFEVSPGMLTPRTDSETLIEAALRRRPRSAALRIVDLGCGTGALLAALVSEYRSAVGIAVDIDPHAVALANRNFARLGFAARARARGGDWFEGLEGVFDLIISNPPYIPADARRSLPREVRDYEDPRALFAGADGLDAFQRILAAAPGRIAPDGLVVLEIGWDQADEVKKLATKAFPTALIVVERDLSARPRALIIDLEAARN